jgi:hypothetical protein
MKFTRKDYNWLLICILIAIVLIGIFSFIIANSTYTIAFQMDDNTLEAVKSINWSALPK